ncbi:T9SS type A sorting domain-containing protein [Fulvivirgaceae bacterium PWU4]|uniref:T9SS type A sorting domain-containing protein n=1 Tax=Chryseosolibacter histidini TaxID=2782349 RepID=A0AAP2DPV1_9BACT|nr:T9SS type A sorting domain-containing protein [Chryseosolibacter histidini]MBT1700295.1 T9SS type A sorting domain-containing protein [Chryseosolibacter histidini]
MIRSSLLVFLLMPLMAHAQFTYTMDQQIVVQGTDGNALAMPWAGGLNAAQYNAMDLNHDGKDDLVLFDRMADKVITFLNQNNQYHYAPEYEVFFPAEISNWLQLRDHNCDGKKDIFTGHQLGMRVYTNVTPEGGAPAWKEFLFHAGPGASKTEVLLSKGFSVLKVNLQIQSDDVPAIIDADGDGDLDIFNIQYASSGVEFHKNLSIEKGWSCDSLDFERQTRTWGNFRECGCGVIALHGEDCPAAGRVKHAGGKSLLSIDLNGDKQLDLIFSEATCTQLFQLVNEGTLENPAINKYSTFPAIQPANIVVYPGAYYEDVDFDGAKDLIATPNGFTREFLSADYTQSNLFYKNTGTTANPAFSLVKRNFLQEHMIDVGDNAVPAFADLDGDGDFDMIISSYTSGTLRSSIFLYENIGTPAEPAFRLVTKDYLFLSFSSFYNMKVQFADVNNDNAQDLVFTATLLNNNVTDLYAILNKGRDVFDFNDQPIVNMNFDLTFSENINVVDIDSDGYEDLLVGRGNGALQYWKNNGTPGQFGFTLVDDTYLGLTSSVLRQNPACAVADLDADGTLDLIYGDQTGILKIVRDFRNASDADAEDATTSVVFNPLITDQNPYMEQDLGGRIWPTVVNLFNSTKPAIVTGNVMGGVTVLKNDEGQALPKEPVVEIYPNPVSKTQTLNIKVDRTAIVQILSPLGQQLSQPTRLQAHQRYQYQLPSLSAGLYLLKFTVGNNTQVKRLVITN